MPLMTELKNGDEVEIIGLRRSRPGDVLDRQRERLGGVVHVGLVGTISVVVLEDPERVGARCASTDIEVVTSGVGGRKGLRGPDLDESEVRAEGRDVVTDVSIHDGAVKGDDITVVVADDIDVVSSETGTDPECGTRSQQCLGVRTQTQIRE